jgi:hypothetical protein
MITHKTVMAAATVLFIAPAAPALAHDDYGDHVQHREYHEDMRDAHRQAHEEGFNSWAEHRAYHRAMRDMHDNYHDSHPGNGHDHWRWWRPWGGWGPYQGGYRGY